MTARHNICLMGFGEVGQILAADLKLKAASIAAWDILFPDDNSGPSRAAEEIQRRESAPDAAAGASIVISAVTAANAVDAARSVSNALEGGAAYLDLNSVSPAAKREAGDIINAAGGCFIEAAVMSPVPPNCAR